MQRTHLGLDGRLGDEVFTGDLSLGSPSCPGLC